MSEESTDTQQKMESILSEKNELVAKLKVSEEVYFFHVGVTMIDYFWSGLPIRA